MRHVAERKDKRVTAGGLRGATTVTEPAGMGPATERGVEVAREKATQRDVEVAVEKATERDVDVAADQAEAATCDQPVEEGVASSQTDGVGRIRAQPTPATTLSPTAAAETTRAAHGGAVVTAEEWRLRVVKWTPMLISAITTLWLLRKAIRKGLIGSTVRRGVILFTFISRVVDIMQLLGVGSLLQQRLS
tara:strand:- start:1825 stop:2397 length:573 start_codon:yes stop_codon:yes gene_type:complete